MAFVNQASNVLFGPQPRDLGGNTHQYESVQRGGRARKSKKAKKSKAKKPHPKTKKSKTRTRVYK